MSDLIKIPILLAILVLSGFALWHAIKGSIAKRPVRKRAVIVYAIWLATMLVCMVLIHPVMLLLSLFILGRLFLLNELTLGLWGGVMPQGVYEDINDMGINTLFTGVLVYIDYAIVYGFYYG